MESDLCAARSRLSTCTVTSWRGALFNTRLPPPLLLGALHRACHFSMLSRAIGVAAATICLGAITFVTPSWAVPITYNLTLTQGQVGNVVPANTVAGSGSLMIDGPVPASGQNTFSEANGLL